MGVLGDWLSRVVEAETEREEDGGSRAGRGLLCRLNGISDVTLTICLIS